MSVPDVLAVRSYLLALQQSYCEVLAKEDGSTVFGVDHWQRDTTGEGCTRVLSDGALIEQGAVNFSHVFGNTLPQAASAKNPALIDARFQAMGVSVIIHPRNPYVPTAHANLRFLMAETPNGKQVWWFGGGFDLTPFYPFAEDCVHWHQTALKACLPFGKDVYSTFKTAADEYFYLKHRQECRGIGGLFFDDLNQWPFETCFQFIQSVGSHFLSAYLPIVTTRKTRVFGDNERQFQLYRRGRYVEFNLLYDRGTLFGLQFGGRIESILASLPPMARWQYQWQPMVESDEAKLADFLQPQDWLKGNGALY
jgi:coproporphyrinogen III oxidase